MDDTPSSSRPQLYVEDSSDEELLELRPISRRSNLTPQQARIRYSRARPENRHLIKQEVSPGASAPRPFRGVSQLLERPVKLHTESVEESDSDNDQLPHTQLIPQTDLPRALRFCSEAASTVTPEANLGMSFGTVSGRKETADIATGSTRMLLDARGADLVEDVMEDAPESVKKQRLSELTPGPQQSGLFPDPENPASAHRSFLASNLANLAYVPSSARRLTPKKGASFKHATEVKFE